MFLPTQRHELPDHFLAFANPTRLRILQRLGEVGEDLRELCFAHRLKHCR